MNVYENREAFNKDVEDLIKSLPGNVKELTLTMTFEDESLYSDDSGRLTEKNIFVSHRRLRS